MAFWIYHATIVQIRYQFDGENYFVRMLDQFHHIEFEKLISVYKIEDLEIIKKYFKEIMILTRRNGRLFTALSSNFQGCISFQWKPAFLLFTVALEALLTFKRGPGVTKRLATSYACLVETGYKRNSAYKKFYKLYNLRSEIMHGSQRKYSRPNTNLKKLVELSNLLRILWAKILNDEDLIDKLEKEDSERELFFNSISKKFIAPKNTL